MFTLPNEVEIINATPHSIVFWTDGWPEPVSVESHGILSANPTEIPAGRDAVVQLVKTEFRATEQGKQQVKAWQEKHPGALIIGSIIAAQAYAGSVVSMVPHPDFNRVPPPEKRMLPDKFNIY